MQSSTIDKEEIKELSQKAEKNKKTSGNKIQKIFTILFSLGTIGIVLVLFLLYGPFIGFREWLITTAMTTMTHQYFATWFYDDETIAYVLSKNKVIEIDEITDQSSITIGKIEQKDEYENEYERQILEKDPKNNDYKIIEIKEKGYDGYLVAVYDASRVQTVVTQKLGTSGQYLTKMATNNDALIAINGGGFDDPNFNSTGGSPLGFTISQGKYITSKPYNGSGGIIGFTEDDKLILGKVSEAKAKEMKIRDAVTFGPFLIVNGKASEVLGNGGWGTAPRTAIGQRKDGIVLFLVLDGRTASKPGADMDDLIKIMQRYGAYNAANLDGGSSSELIINHEIINTPVAGGSNGLRDMSTFWIVK